MSPISSLVQGHLGGSFALAIKTPSVARLFMLMTMAADFQYQQAQDKRLTSKHHNPKCSIESIMTILLAQQFASDENVLAALKFASSHELEYMVNALKRSAWITDWSLENASIQSNPLGADLKLASVGYTIGIDQRSNCCNTENNKQIGTWVRRVQAAGGENSVSIIRL